MPNQDKISKDEFANTIAIKIDGPDFPSDKFIKILRNFFLILEEIDKATSENGEQTVEWSVEAIKPGSLALETKGLPKAEAISFGRSSEIICTFANGLESLRKSSNIPEGFSNTAMRSTRVFVESINPDDIAEIDFMSKNWNFQHIHEVAENLLPKAKKTYSYWGSIEGKLVSLDAEKKIKFGLRSNLQPKLIHCFVDDEKLFQEALNAIRCRVYIYGLIRQSIDGEKQNIKAREIKVLPDKNQIPNSEKILQMLRGKG
jgi:hypothetical protein